MSNLRRIAIVIAVVAFVALIMASFKGSDVLDRAIIIGMGIDQSGDAISLTAEIVSPGNGGEQVGTFSKTVTAKGKTVAEAIQVVAEKTGKEASLGQCVVIILGQDFYKNVDFTDSVNFLVNHHSLKESAVMCCCEGTAEKVLNYGNAISQSISLSVASMLLDQAQNMAVPTSNLLTFARSQNELNCTGFLNKITFVPSENKDAQDPDKTQGYFTYRELSVFRSNQFVCELTEEEVMGMSVFITEIKGDNFVSNAENIPYTVQVNDKEIKQNPVDGGFEIELTLFVRFARTDSEEVTGAITAKKDKEISEKVLQDVQKQALQLAERFLAKQVEYNIDLLNFHEIYRQKDGTNKQLATKPMSDFPVTLTIHVEEN